MKKFFITVLAATLLSVPSMANTALQAAVQSGNQQQIAQAVQGTVGAVVNAAGASAASLAAGVSDSTVITDITAAIQNNAKIASGLDAVNSKMEEMKDSLTNEQKGLLLNLVKLMASAKDINPNTSDAGEKALLAFITNDQNNGIINAESFFGDNASIAANQLFTEVVAGVNSGKSAGEAVIGAIASIRNVDEATARNTAEQMFQDCGEAAAAGGSL